LKSTIQHLLLPEVKGSPKKQGGIEKTLMREGELHTIEEGVSR
jgi:hypothetical protein